jgi:hypothetical protein
MPVILIGSFLNRGNRYKYLCHDWQGASQSRKVPFGQKKNEQQQNPVYYRHFAVSIPEKT